MVVESIDSRFIHMQYVHIEKWLSIIFHLKLGSIWTYVWLIVSRYANKILLYIIHITHIIQKFAKIIQMLQIQVMDVMLCGYKDPSKISHLKQRWYFHLLLFIILFLKFENWPKKNVCAWLNFYRSDTIDSYAIHSGIQNTKLHKNKNREEKNAR